ncbi:arylesterase [Comamonas sp. Y33R10-2]|uniref:GDSL-type esterase/lipase family protein n=1 Tax=Comamonas sp. Y33R10-2 TaxID=2853257 RepID=UPI001C5C95DC|nr:GDSL-type esterase/lipase family protein [Comamonas sp. Y33R10-2]QXZ08981.1 arylesterase [Comamonas sp. Y33R10-2]
MKLIFDPSRRDALQMLRTAAVLTGGSALLAACGKKSAKAAAIPAGSTVLALGDSLTQGVGASADTAYPRVLAERTGWKVVNAGISGETSSQIGSRLPGLLDEHQPALVILCAGGNDWLQRNSAQGTQDEISRMLQLCKSKAIPVLLVAVPELSMSAALTGRMKDHPIYKTLAQDYKVALLADAWSDVLSDKALRADQVHANAQGYARFTELLAAQAKASGFLA